MKTTDTIDGHEITIDWETTSPVFGAWNSYIIHKVGNDTYEKSGGIRIEGAQLVDADGSYSLPSVVAEALEKNGIFVPSSFLA